MFDNETIELYKMAYVEAFNKSKKTSYNMRKKDAQNYAAAVCPEGERAIVAFGRVLSKHGRPETDIEWLGQRVAASLSNLRLKSIHDLQYKDIIKHSKESILEMGENNTTYIDKYRTACDRFDFIPNDMLLAHFFGNSRATWCNVRKRMAELGYILSDHQFGYTINKRPPRKQLSIPDVPNNNIDPKMIASIVEEVMKKLKK